MAALNHEIQEALAEVELVCTSEMCPEQYEVHYRGQQIGYMRLRHGRFTVYYPDHNGIQVYEARTNGDGAFEHDERDEYLEAAKIALLSRELNIELEREETSNLDEDRIADLVKEIRLECTSEICPEQYNAYLNGSQIGYLRVRHGHFTATYPQNWGDDVYEAAIQGDGAFTSDERVEQLRAAFRALIIRHMGSELEQSPGHRFG